MRALIDDQPKIFSLKDILQGFIQQRLENISKKAQFIYHKNQKELINLETRIFIINNYQEIAQIASTSASDEEREQKLKTRFATELQKLQERLQIIQETTSDAAEKNANLEQEAINRILDTPASFRQFTPERREKLENNITELYQKNEGLQGIFNSEEVRKEKLITELRELQKTYAKDHRRTEFTEEFHTIDERKLTPHEERLVILSQVENKKENTVNTYLNVHEINSLEGTNVPSQGKELKRRGSSLEVIKLSRRDDL
jgi:DNA gyrase subunit A